MSAGVAAILCITQIAFIIVQNALLANYGWFWITNLDVLTNVPTLEHGLKSVIAIVMSSNNSEMAAETINFELKFSLSLTSSLLKFYIDCFLWPLYNMDTKLCSC